MSHLRKRAAYLLAALLLALGCAAVLLAVPARGQSSGEIRDAAGDYLNFWYGGYPVSVYRGISVNNSVHIQWLPGGGFEIRDDYHADGSCVGDRGNNPGDPRLGGGDNCPSDGNAGWGTKYHVAYQCGNGWALFQANHWPGRYVGFRSYNGAPVYANTSGTCLKQTS